VEAEAVRRAERRHRPPTSPPSTPRRGATWCSGAASNRTARRAWLARRKSKRARRRSVTRPQATAQRGMKAPPSVASTRSAAPIVLPWMPWLFGSSSTAVTMSGPVSCRPAARAKRMAPARSPKSPGERPRERAVSTPRACKSFASRPARRAWSRLKRAIHSSPNALPARASLSPRRDRRAPARAARGRVAPAARASRCRPLARLALRTASARATGAAAGVVRRCSFRMATTARYFEPAWEPHFHEGLRVRA
jgi:hypothetical protein